MPANAYPGVFAHRFLANNPALNWKPSKGNEGLQAGQRVRHKKFGADVIIDYAGQGKHTRIQAKFDDCGLKLRQSRSRLTKIRRSLDCRTRRKRSFNH